MAKQIINIGLSANDKSGDPLRTAFEKVNANFTELYNTTLADLQIPDQEGQEGKFLRTDGSNLSWVEIITDTSQLVNGLHTVSLGSDGITTLPGGGTIDNSSGVTVPTGTISTFSNDGSSTPGIDNTNVVYLDNTLAAQAIQAGWIITFANSTQKTVTAADTGLPPNADKRMLEFTGVITLSSADVWPLTVQSSDYNEGLNINNLELTPDGTTAWTFDSNGILTLPANGDIQNSTGTSVLGVPTVLDGGNASTTF